MRIFALCSDLPVVMVVAPQAVFLTIDVVALGGEGTIRMKCAEQSVPNSAGSIRRHFASISKLNAAIRECYLSNVKLAHVH